MSTLEFKDDLADPAWQVFWNVPAQAADTDISIADPTNLPKRFYRLRTSGQ